MQRVQGPWWDAKTTAYVGDKGIDVILDGPDGSTIGVQVKRYKKERRIEADQIRSLAGALLQNRHTKGIFITTSKYRKGAKEAARELTSIGHPIELIDTERFLAALGVAQHNSFEFDEKKAISCVLSHGLHIGTAVHKDFVPGRTSEIGRWSQGYRPAQSCSIFKMRTIDFRIILALLGC